MSNYKATLGKQYQQACENCEEICKKATYTDEGGFMPILEACYEREKLAEQLKKL